LECSASSALVRLHLSFPALSLDRVSVLAILRLFPIKVEGYLRHQLKKILWYELLWNVSGYDGILLESHIWEKT
jgi:hypothetical protein